jgi:hypothetical protein
MAGFEMRARTSLHHPGLTPSVLSALGLLAVLVAVVVWTLTLPIPPLRTYRLPDGTVLRLEGVTLGSEHRLVRGRYWQRLLAPFLQGPLAHYGPSVTTWRLPTPNAAVFWLTWTASSPLTNWTRATAVDDTGEEVELTGTHIQFMRPDGPDEKLCGWVAPAFPRRGREIELRLYSPGRAAPVAVFRVPNPAPEPHPTWTPMRLPATQSAGRLTVTLTKLETGRLAPPSVPLDRPARHWTRAEFRVRENGRPTDRWEPVGAVLSDATGNVLTPPAAPRPSASGAVADWEWTLHQHAGDAAQLAFEGNLPAGEAAWKVRVELAPSRHLTPEELATAHVPLVNPGGPARANGPHGAGIEVLLDQAKFARSGSLDVEVRQWAPKEGRRVGLLRAVGDQGQRFAVKGPGLQFLSSRRETGGVRVWGSWAGGSMTQTPMPYSSRSYSIRGSPGARALDLTLASVKSRFVEFVVRPTLVSGG